MLRVSVRYRFTLAGRNNAGAVRTKETPLSSPLAEEVAKSPQLADASPELARILKRSQILTPPRFAVSDIRCETVMVAMRDGVWLATDVYLPPVVPAPAIAVRIPYSRGLDHYVGAFVSLARRGYVVVSQDCRGTGDSEPDVWDYFVREPEDGYDFVEWICGQGWFDGFLGSCGGSYVGQTQWPMAMHPRMSTIVPDVSGLGVAVNTVRLHMFFNTFARSVGKGEDKVDVPYAEFEAHMLEETLASGYFNEPLELRLSDALVAQYPELATLSPDEGRRWLWEHYCALTCAERAEFVKEVTGARNVTMVDIESLPAFFGHTISHDSHTLPHRDPAELVRGLQAPALMRTGWYDWCLNDALATWELLRRSAVGPVRSRSRLIVAPSAHNMPGYQEGMAEHPELHHAHGLATSVELLHHWYSAVREDTVDVWPRVIFYLMGANDWRTADDWPVPGARDVTLFLHHNGRLSSEAPTTSDAARYTYDPNDPTPTVGGSIVSYVYPPGSVDLSAVQQRPDVVTYTTDVLDSDLDVVGPLRMVLYASSSAVDTDFSARLSDVFPDGRAIQLQSGMLRARFRNLYGEPELLEPGRIYRFEIDMWATANRFKAGHRLRVDISSADFPKFDRNTNLGGAAGAPVPAQQAIYHDPDHPSQLRLSVLDESGSEHVDRDGDGAVRVMEDASR